MKLALVMGSKERGARTLGEIVKGPLPYSEAQSFIKETDHSKSDWQHFAIAVIKPERKFLAESLAEQYKARKKAEAKAKAEAKTEKAEVGV